MATYACSDLHGNKELLNQILEFIKPSDIVYFLGDAADKGPDGWEMIKTILSDEGFIYIKGNHDDMLIKAARRKSRQDYDLLEYNGGEKTFNDMLNDLSWDAWIDMLNQCPTRMKYINTRGETVLLSHAGYTPHVDIDLPSDYDLIWDRSHFYEGWDENDFEHTIVVHGHTPIDYLLLPGEKHPEGPLWYANNHKVDIDHGAHYTGKCILLNLDTWESNVFSVEK